MQKFSEPQVEMLIDLVRDKPALYDKSDDKYKITDGKDQMWEEIARTINADKKDCKKAWRSLRDQFIKCAKDCKGSTGEVASSTRKKYKYYEQLDFLNNSIKPEVHSENFKLKKEDEDDNDWSKYLFLLKESSVLDPLQSTLDCSNSSVSHDDCGEASNRTRVAAQSSISNFECFSESSHAKKRKKEDITEIFKEFLRTFLSNASSQRNTTELDSVDKFFLTVAATVKTYNLSVSEMALLQCKILTVATEELEKYKH